MLQIDLCSTYNYVHFIKLVLFLSFTGHIVNIMTSLVVLLLYLYLSLTSSQNLGLTESD